MRANSPPKTIPNIEIGYRLLFFLATAISSNRNVPSGD